jgi:predicted DCC family thiol-disulfide oxidoreductase YuxK
MMTTRTTVKTWSPIILSDDNTRSTSATLTSPVLVFDGECEFCRACVRFITRRTRRPLVVVAYQEADLVVLRLTREQCESAVQWVDVSGGIASAHLAVARALRYARAPWSMAGAVIALPGLSRIAAWVYERVARRRSCDSPNSARRFF